jgi:DNA mismatch endonuclease, patch repair protein
MDKYKPSIRSYVMSRIRGRDTEAERSLRRSLWAKGLRGYRTHARLPGTPDIVWHSIRLAVFVDGCFWHRCPHCQIPMPSSNRAYWRPKLKCNELRDRSVDEQLHLLGWTVVRFWEHEVKRHPVRCAAEVFKKYSVLCAGAAHKGRVSSR